jgi:hypothetical protein
LLYLFIHCYCSEILTYGNGFRDHIFVEILPE